MSLSAAAASFAVSFVYIFLKATQQISVVTQRYWFVLPTSIGLGLCEATILLYVVQAGTIWLGIVNGCGAGLGALAAMVFHRKVH